VEIKCKEMYINVVCQHLATIKIKNYVFN